MQKFHLMCTTELGVYAYVPVSMCYKKMAKCKSEEFVDVSEVGFFPCRLWSQLVVALRFLNLARR